MQQFGQDILPLLLLFAISVTGLMLTASCTWMKGYAHDFLAILHGAAPVGHQYRRRREVVRDR